MATITQFISTLQGIGIFNFYLPFFILFAIFYALLTKSGIFGGPESGIARKVNLIVALGASAYVLIYSPISGTAITLGEYLSKLFGQTFVILMTILAIVMIGYVLLPSVGIKMSAGNFAKYFVIFLIILGIGLFLSSGGFTYFVPAGPTTILPWISLSIEEIAIISLVFLTGLALYWLVGKPEEEALKEKVWQETKKRAAEAAAKGG